MNSCIVEASADARVDDGRSDQQNLVLASELAAKEGSHRRCHIHARARMCVVVGFHTTCDLTPWC